MLADYNILTSCRAMLSHVGGLSGIDGRARMSKSLGNTLTFSATEQQISQAANDTDPDHLVISDPGKVEGNIVFMAACLSPRSRRRRANEVYLCGGLGDMTCKRELEQYYAPSIPDEPLYCRIKTI